MRLNYSSRFWLFAPLALLLGLGVWVSVHWYNVTAVLDKKLTAMNGHEAAPGITVSYASKSISGFPFNIDVVFTGLAVSGQGAHGPFRWTTQNFALHGLTYGPVQYIYEAADNQSLSWIDGGGKSRVVNFLPALLHASSVVNPRGLARFDLDMGAAGGTLDGARFTVERLQLHLRRDPKVDALDLLVSADGLKSDAASTKAASVATTISHAGALAPLLAGSMSWSDAHTAWQLAGGNAGGPADESQALRDLLASLY